MYKNVLEEGCNMADQNHAVVGYYGNEREAIRTIEDLKERGYRADQISVISKSQEETEHITEETDTAAGEGAAAGALTGGAIGGIGGVLAGIGALAVPGIGPVLAAGPIAAGLAGAAAGAGVGGLAGALIGMGVPEDEAREYEEHVNQGKILVLVEENPGGTPVRDEADTRGITAERRETFAEDRAGTPYVGGADKRYRDSDDLANRERVTIRPNNAARGAGNGAYGEGPETIRGNRNLIENDVIGNDDERRPITGNDLATDRDPVTDEDLGRGRIDNGRTIDLDDDRDRRK